MKWTPERTAAETGVASKLRAASKFYRFLWEIRDELFDDEFQDELIKSYDPRGQDPCPPALLAMVMLLQRYDNVSDADAVETAAHDRRWQLVLGTLGGDKAPFGQGTLVRFRLRMIAHDLDRALVNRTVELGKKTGLFGWQKLRVALDSSPQRGAGRVEDTWNLIGRAMSKVVHAVSLALGLDEQTVITRAGLTLLTGDSIKAALDIDWDDEQAQTAGLQKLLGQVEALERWVVKRASKQAEMPPLKDALTVLRKVVNQDLEPDPSGGQRLKDEVAQERMISLGDPEMRHGRKSRTKLFNGYKRHIAIAHNLIVATAVLPANLPEHVAAEPLLEGARAHGSIEVLDIDRGYLASPTVQALYKDGVTIHSRAWAARNQGRFTKEQFRINMRRRIVVCPSGATATITESGRAKFSVAECGRCALKGECTGAKSRTIKVHAAERLLIELRRNQRSRAGRRELRRRVTVEHRLARIGATQGDRARYRGARKNQLDLNRAAAVVNLFEVARLRAA
jgi:hypothetical protein